MKKNFQAFRDQVRRARPDLSAWMDEKTAREHTLTGRFIYVSVGHGRWLSDASSV